MRQPPANHRPRTCPASRLVHGLLAALSLLFTPAFASTTNSNSDIQTSTPTLAEQQARLAEHRARFDDASNPLDHRQATLDDLIHITRQMVDTFSDHEQRPIWQTDLAELLLVPALQSVHQGATFFYEFGHPTSDQQAAVERLAPIALQAAAAAHHTLHHARQPSPDTAAIHQRTRYYLAQAAYYVAIFPDDHPYYTRLSDRPPDAERQRLLRLVIDSLSDFDQTTHSPGILTTAYAFTARAHMRQHDFDEAERAFTRAIELNADGVDDLIAHLGRVENAMLAGRHARAIDRVAALHAHPAARQSPLYRLLVTDSHHRTLLAEADRAATRAAAYEPYLHMLDAVPDRDAASLREHLHQRWSDHFAGRFEDEPDMFAAMPPRVLAGIASAARRQGQNLTLNARDTTDPALTEQARTYLNLAIAAAEAVRQSPAAHELASEPLAEAAYSEAVAVYLLAPRHPDNLLRAAGLMIDLATAMPDQPVAEQAIANALTLLRAVRRLDQRPPAFDAVYRRAAEVLFREFPTTSAADDERFHFGYELLHNTGRYKQAADMFAQVPATHETYFQAQAACAVALARHARQADEDARHAVYRRAVDVATQVRDEAHAIVDASDVTAHRLQTARRAAAEARLVLARLAMDQGDADDALIHLDSFEQTYKHDDSLVRDAMEQRILALAHRDQLDEAAHLATEMMNRFRDDATHVIDHLLSTIDTRIEEQTHMLRQVREPSRREVIEQRIQSLADTAVSLTDLLLDWARDQQLDDRELLHFHLARAQALRLVGQPDEAVDLLSPYLDRFPANANLLHEYAESLFALGDEASLVQATHIYDNLIRGLEPPAAFWWNAWTRRLQINDTLNQATETIPLRIRQLRRTDPDLGGPRYRETLQALEARHEP